MRTDQDIKLSRAALAARILETIIHATARGAPLLVFGLGLIGWATTCPGHPADSFYKTMQLFGLNFDLPSQGCRAPTLPLLIARVGAGAVTLGFLILLTRGSRAHLMALLRRISPGPAIGIIGYGRVGKAIARQSRRQGFSVAAVDRRVDERDRRTAAAHGVELHIADGTDDALDRWPVGLSGLRPVVVACATDEDSITAAMRIDERRSMRGGRRQRLWVHLRSSELIHRLREGVDLLAGPGRDDRSVLPFQLDEASAHALFEVHPPAARAVAAGHKAVHLVIYGFDREFAWVVAQEAMLNGMMPAPSLRAPILSILTDDAVRAARRWEARYPGATAVTVDGTSDVVSNETERDVTAHVRFFGIDLEALDWSRQGPLASLVAPDPGAAGLDGLAHAVPANLHLFCLEDDHASLAAALTLRLAMIRGDVPPAPIAMQSAQGLMNLPEQAGQWQKAFFAAGGAAQAAPYLPFLNRHITEVARLFAGAEYDRLPETLRVSNHRAAYHFVQKLILLGFEDASALKAGFGLGRDGMGWLDRLTDADRARLGLFEHVRWRTDRLVDGWRGGARDDERRLRHQLQARIAEYHDLGPAEWLKDTDHLSKFGSLSLPAVGTKRVVDHCWDGTPPEWRFVDDTLTLDFPRGAARPVLPEPSANEEYRLRLLIPPEKVWAGSGTPNDRRTAVRAAVKDFALGLRGRVVLERLSCTDWEWLDRDLPPHIEGVSLPPLVVGFAGPTDRSRFGDADTLAAAIRRWMDEMAPPGGVVPLITGLAPGADEIAVRCWHERRYGPILGLYPFGTDIAPRHAASPDATISLDLVSLLAEHRLATEGPTPHVAVANGILERATVLLTVLSDDEAAAIDATTPTDGGTASTLADARLRRMHVHRIRPVASGRLA